MIININLNVETMNAVFLCAFTVSEWPVFSLINNNKRLIFLLNLFFDIFCDPSLNFLTACGGKMFIFTNLSHEIFKIPFFFPLEQIAIFLLDTTFTTSVGVSGM